MQVIIIDALGFSDTIVIGYDGQAYYGIDAIFGEEDISSIPWMDIRLMCA